MDAKKIKYDLSMHCAVMDVLWKRYTNDGSVPDNYDIRKDIMDKFSCYYMHFSVLHKSNWDALIDEMEKADEAAERQDIFN